MSQQGYVTLRRSLALASFIVMALFLVACNRAKPPSPVIQDDYTLTVEILADSTVAATETYYGGRVIVWQPKAGFAIMGLKQKAWQALQKDSTKAKDLVPETNQSAVKAPMAEANGFSAWSSGFSAWSSGFSAWSSGATSLTPTENHPIWEQVGLFESHDLAPNLGEGVKIAIIDTGIDLEHPAFQSHLAPTPEWRDFVDGDDYPQEEADGAAYGHGTAAAGIALQVAPNSTLLPLRVLAPNGAGDITHVAAAIDWAVAKGADVINLSLGTSKKSKAISNMVDYATSQGVYVVAASGNTGDENISYPAADARKTSDEAFIVGVGSVTTADVKSEFSTYGSKLELVAPGEAIYTTAPSGKLTSATGTSFAAPIVSGALALALGDDAEPSLMGQALNTTAMSLDAISGNAAYAKKLGWGRINIAAFLGTFLNKQPEEKTVNVRFPGHQIGGEDTRFTLALEASDSAGGSLSFAATGLPEGLSLDPATGVIDGVIAAGLEGNVYPVTVTVSSDNGPDLPGSTSFDLSVELFGLSPYQGKVVISEILYKQSHSSAHDEFIEVYNAGDVAVDMAGWGLWDANPKLDGPAELGGVIPQTDDLLQPGKYALFWTTEYASLVSDGETLEYVNDRENYSLSNAGDDVWFLDSEGRIVDYVAFGGNSGHEIGFPPPAALGLWDASYQLELGNTVKGQSISLTPHGVDGNTSACWEPTTSADASGRCAGAQSTVDSDNTYTNRVSSAAKPNN